MASGSVSAGIGKYNKQVASGAREAWNKAKEKKGSPKLTKGGYPAKWDS